MKQTSIHSRKLMSIIELLYYSFIISTISILFIGYQYGEGDSLFLLMPALKNIDPLYLINDHFVNSSVEFGPRYYWTLLVSFLVQVQKHGRE